MNCCDDYGQCKRGFNCPVRAACELPEPPAIESDLDFIMRWMWTGMAWLGFFSMIGIIALVWGYLS